MKSHFFTLPLAVFAAIFYGCMADGTDTIVPEDYVWLSGVSSSSSSFEYSSSSVEISSSSSALSSSSSFEQSSSSAEISSSSSTPPKTYTIVIDISDNVTGDNVTVSPDKGTANTTVTLSYTVANTAANNQLEFGGVNAAIALVESSGSGTRTYTISDADATDGVITITAVFTHTNLIIDHIVFSEHDKGHITKTYGDAAFTNAVTTAHSGTEPITYHSSDESVATVNGSGQVTIHNAGSAVISAEKAADAIYAHAQTTYTLTVNPKPVTITGLSASSKAYDGTATATVTGTAVISGRVGSDDVTAVPGTASFANAAVGNNKTVTFSGWSLGGAKASNYTLSAQPASVTANILPDGSANAPFLVSNEAELRKVGTGTDGWTLSANYRQTANITLTGGAFTRIGNNTTKFTGTYDGDGKTITGLTMTMTSTYTGLFGNIGASGTVKNMNVTGTVSSDGANRIYIGGIAGMNEGTIDNCVFNGTINGNATTNDNIGGIVGENSSTGTVSNSKNNATVIGRNQTGGIAGQNNGTVINSSNTGAVTGNNQVGGIAGTAQGKVENCYNTGAITGYQQVGGIAGQNVHATSYIKNSYNTGAVTGNNSGSYNIGGITGYNQTNALVEYCYNTGVVSSLTGSNGTGGIVGNSASGTTVRYCVSLGIRVTGSSNIGRVVGNNGGATLTGNSAREDMVIGAPGSEFTVTGTANNGHGSGISLGVGQQGSVFSGWNYSTIWNISGNLVVGGDLPTLKDNTQSPAPTLPGSNPALGTAANPFLVANETDLRKVGTETTAGGWTVSAHYKQTQNITMTGGNFPGISNSTNRFFGSYDGGGYTITGFSQVTSSSNVGFFGYIGASGTVKNINLTGTITQNGSNTSFTGGIAGYNVGTIDNCSFSGTVNGGTNNDDVGGIAGRNTGTIINSRSNATVSGRTRVGGIVGSNNGKIDNSYNTGAVTGSQQVGGIAGGNSDSGNYIKNCYNTGNVTATTATTTANAGGIVGQSSALIEYCYNTGNVSGTGNIGGIVGYINPGCTVRYCVSLGARVTGTSTGRIAGTNNGGTLSTNSARADMKVGASGAEAVPTTNIGATATNGASVTVGTAMSTFFSGWDTTTIWNTGGNLTVGVNLPTLKTNTQSPAPTLPASP